MAKHDRTHEDPLGECGEDQECRWARNCGVCSGELAAAGPHLQVLPVRVTVDLVADLHGFLRGYAQARDVAAADVIRELIRQVRADPDLSARVTAELARRQEALAEAMRAARE